MSLRAVPVVVLLGCVAPEPPGPAPANPFLAASRWPISHGSPWAQASSAVPLFDGEDGAVVETVPSGSVSITTALGATGADGTTPIWLSSPLQVTKVLHTPEGLEAVATLPRVGGLSDFLAGAYTFVDVDGRFFAAERGRLVRFDDDPADARSAIRRGAEWELPEPREDETIVGLGMTWDGHPVVATSAARVAVLTRDLELVDVVELDAGAAVSNSLATDADGALFVVTSRALHRVQWTGSALSLDPADGAWSAPYRGAEGDAVAGRLGLGSGSTPTVMGDADGERLVVVTDGQALMHLDLFWAGDIPEDWDGLGEGRDPRLAAEVPVTFGDPEATRSVSEQSVLVSGWSAVVVNNDYGEVPEGTNPVLAGLVARGVEQFRQDPVARRLASAWVQPEVACPNGIPAVSQPSDRMVCVGRRGPAWTLEVLDWSTGEEAFHVVLGEESSFNSVYAGVAIGPDGDLLTGTLGGLVRARRR